MQNEIFTLDKEVYYLIIFSLLSLVLIYVFNLDFVIADLIYAPTNSWLYKDAWFTSKLMHKYGKLSLILLYLIFLIVFVLQNKKQQSKKQSYGKIVLLISLLSGTSIVGLLNHTLEMDCPWDLIRYGGDKPFFNLFHYAQASLPSSHCFPSGHASSAFTWFSLYFYAAIFHRQHRLKILTLVLILGYVFGLGQQLRGAHFISHDIWSMLVCLLINLGIYKFAFGDLVLRRILKN